MEKKGVITAKIVWYLSLLLVVGIAVLFVKTDFTITSLAVYEEQEEIKIWDFSDPASYIYDSELIKISDGSVQLVLTTTNNYWNTTDETDYSLISALYNPKDKTNKINNLDNKKLQINENKILDLFFNENLNNGDIISIYIDEGEEGNIYLCDKGVLCDFSNYGLVSYTNENNDGDGEEEEEDSEDDDDDNDDENDDSEGWYNITVTGLNSPTKVFNLHPSDNIKINYITSTQGDIIKALYNPSDKTSKVNQIDNKKLEINKNKIFNLIFDHVIENDDLISLYMKSGSNTDIYLCDYGQACSSPGYGTIGYDGNEGWYNITVSGLNSPTDSFNLDPTKVKINYVKTVHIEIEKHSETNITYPSSGEIITPDLEIANLYSWGSFYSTKELNGQTINYQYSTNSGETWVDVPSGGDLSSINSSKIKFKATLNSDQAGTPILDNISLSYTTLVCNENWGCTNWDPEICPLNEIQIRTCTDLNECGTEESKPTESQSCTYVPTCSDETKNQDETDVDCGGSCSPCQDGKSCLADTDCMNNCVNSICGIACTENWTEFYSECLTNDSKLKYYFDQNECGTTNNLPTDNGTYVGCDYCTPSLINVSLVEWNDAEECQPNNQRLQNRTKTQYDIKNCGEVQNITFTEEQYIECDYCVLNNCSGSFEEAISADANSVVEVDGTADNNIKLEINTSNTLDGATVSVIEYNWTLNELPPAVNPINTFLEIDSDVKDINSAKIIVYYTDKEIKDANIDENTLKIHYYNDSSGEWEELDSVVNTTGNYVYAIVSHFSLYGLFGNEILSGGASEGSGSSSGSGDSGSSASGGSSSGGGGSSGRSTGAVASAQEKTAPLEELEKTTIKYLKTNQKKMGEENLAAETSCDYTLEVSLPEKVSLFQEDFYEGEIINKGNCVIQKLNLYLSPGLSSFAGFSPATIENLAQGNKSTFLLIRKTGRKKGLFSFLTGSAVANKIIAKEVSGNVTIEGIKEKEEGEELLFTKDLSLDIEILAPEKVIKTIRIVLPGMAFFVILFVLTFILVKNKRSKGKRRQKKSKNFTGKKRP